MIVCMDNELKRCAKCKEYKERDLFGNNKSRKDGKHHSCKSCHTANCRAWQKANPEKVKEKNRAWQKANPEKVAAKTRAWAKANPEKVKVSNRTWKKANPEKIMLCRAQQRAKKSNLDFNLSIDDIHIPERCPVLGILLEYGNTVTNKDSSPSLDKIQNDKGYVKGNVQIVSNRFNSLKKDATFDELILIGEWAKEQKLNAETA
jgi:hypothetical protein